MRQIKMTSYRDPGAGNHLVNGRPLVGVSFQTKFDQVFTLGGHIRPLGLGELILARPEKNYLENSNWQLWAT